MEKGTQNIIEKEDKRKNGSFNIINLDGRIKSIPFDKIKDNFSEKNKNELEKIENENFGPLSQDIDDIIETLSNKNGVQIIIKEDDKIIGYLSSIPANIFYYGIKKDKKFDPNPDNLYIESIAGKINFFSVLKILKEKSKEAGYRKISMHGINKRLNNLLLKMDFSKKYRINDWFEGVWADYMEMDL